MGFNKAYLPSLQELQKQFKDDPNRIIKWLGKADAIVGPVDSVDYTKWIFEVYLVQDSVKKIREANPSYDQVETPLS